MAGSSSSSVDVFDVRKIRRLVELMNEHELAEIDLRQGDHRIRLRKDIEPTVVAAPAGRVVSEAPAGSPPTASAPPAASAPKEEESDALFITSPMVGTFYASSNPDAAPFVKVGDQVGTDTVVCIVEAMKVFNEIQAEKAGRIAAVLVENGAPVEFGQRLFRLETG